MIIRRITTKHHWDIRLRFVKGEKHGGTMGNQAPKNLSGVNRQTNQKAVGMRMAEVCPLQIYPDRRKCG